MKRLVFPSSNRVISARVRIAGQVMPGLESLEVGSNSHYQADTFRCELALNAEGGGDLNWWGDDARQGETYDCRIGMDGDEQSFIIGEADEIRIDPGRGKVTIHGRDLTRRFIDNRIQEAFQNQTSSQIVTTLAQRRGLIPLVTATTGPVQRFYSADHDRVQHDQFSHAGTEWDLITKLAGFEGFDVFVVGKSLYFQPSVDASKVEPYGLAWTPPTLDQPAPRIDLTNFSVGRNLTLAKDVVVEVKTWQSAHGKAPTAYSPKSGRGAVQSGKAQRFTFTRPNMTADQAQKEADRLREDITRHERTLSFECPGEMDLTCRDVLALNGCGGFDQRYYINSITRSVSFDQGFTMRVEGKNHTVESAAPSS